MGYQELIKALEKEVQDEVDQIWREAKGKAQEVEEDLNKKISYLRAMREDEYNRLLKEKISDILFNAHEKARLIRLTAEKTMADRLLSLSYELLPLLRTADYNGVFHRLKKEIPEGRWHTVLVNPKDFELARESFPNSRIIIDENITGGFDISTGDGLVRIINTFEKRLERIWSRILPEIMDEIRKATG